MKHLLTILSLCCLAFVACSDDDDTRPSHADKDRLETLINTDDERILQFRDDYGTYILSDFDHLLDFAYQFEQAQAWRNATIERLSTEEASTAVGFLCDNIFSAYSDAYKKAYFPRKLLIVKSLKGAALGASQPAADGFHTAVANLNSVTVSRLSAADITAMQSDASRMADFRQRVHTAIIASYLIGARSEYFVDDAYYDLCESYYSSLMTPQRTQAGKLGEDFFYDRGFFFPDDDESTYFVNSVDDLTAYTTHLICMDQATHDIVTGHVTMERKMKIVAQRLKALGVDVAAINPLAADFL